MIERVAGVQSAILSRATDAVREGGSLVYSTCTISKREGDDRIGELLATGRVEATDLGRRSPLLSSPREPRFLQIRPDRDHTDGFFIARLERR